MINAELMPASVIIHLITICEAEFLRRRQRREFDESMYATEYSRRVARVIKTMSVFDIRGLLIACMHQLDNLDGHVNLDEEVACLVASGDFANGDFIWDL